MKVPEGAKSLRKYQTAYNETIRWKPPKFENGNAQVPVSSKDPKEDEITQIYPETHNNPIVKS